VSDERPARPVGAPILVTGYDFGRHLRESKGCNGVIVPAPGGSFLCGSCGATIRHMVLVGMEISIVGQQS
jgi:hypothetical protein